MKRTRTFLTAVFSIVLFCETVFALPAFLDRRSDDKQIESILESSDEILAALYEEQPAARSVIDSAYGYATFSNFGTKILFVGGGTGRGIAVNNKTGRKTFMNMAELQAGLGLGVKKFMLVWVFQTETAFTRFIHSGWELGGQTSAAAKWGESGGSVQGAVQVENGVWVYQMTDKGLALELTAKGTRYYRDHDLNAAYDLP